MKKFLFPLLMVLSLLLSACQSQQASPEEVGTFCADLSAFMVSVEKLTNTSETTTEAEFKAAYDEAVAAGDQLRMSSKAVDSDPAVKELSKAVTDLSVAIDYAGETVPSATNYLQMMTEVNTQYEALQVAYQDVQTGICAP
jgi:hypothetical protein